jgi:hypothetical protein
MQHLPLTNSVFIIAASRLFFTNKPVPKPCFVNCSPFHFPRILHSYCIQMALRCRGNQWHTSTGPVYPEHRLSSPTNINLVVPENSSFQNFCDKFPNLERFVLMDITTEPETAGQYLHSNPPYLDKTSWPSGSHSCFV